MADSCRYGLNDEVSAHSFQKAGESRERGFSGSETLHERPTTINITNKKDNPKSFRMSSIQRELICLLYTTLSTVLFRLALVMIKSFGFGNIFSRKSAMNKMSCSPTPSGYHCEVGGKTTFTI